LSFLGLFIGLSAYPDGFSLGSNIGPESQPSNNEDGIVLDSTNGFGGIPLEDVNGDAVYTDDFRGKVVLIEMMATWCLSCAQQEEILKELYPIYKDKNFVLMSISVDPSFDTRDVLKDHIVKKDIPWLMTRDTTLMMTDFFKVTELATVLIISPEGEVVERFVGVTNLNTLSRSLDELL
jgi:cytochrome oxidase Cu insertion factor (SCO1/SenC/PrrC family)